MCCLPWEQDGSLTVLKPETVSSSLMPALLKELRSKMHSIGGDEFDRVQMKVFDLDNEAEFEQFARGASRDLKVYGSDKVVTYDPMKRIGVMVSHIGASTAISLGAYAYALNEVDKKANQ